MMTLKCAACKKEFQVTNAQFKIMIQTTPCCSAECAVKILNDKDEEIDDDEGNGKKHTS